MSQTYGRVRVTRSKALQWKGEMLKEPLLALYKLDPMCAALVIVVFARMRGYCEVMCGLDESTFEEQCTLDAIEIARGKMKKFTN